MRDLTDSEAEAIFIRVLAIETSLLELRAELKELAEVVAETKEAVKSLSNICRRDRVRFPDAREERAGKLMKPRLLGHLETAALLTPRDDGNSVPKIHLRPWIVGSNSSDADMKEVQNQRIACGWNYERVPIWQDEIQRGYRRLWFIHIQTPEPLGEPAGMISLNLYDPVDSSVANLRAPPPHTGDRVEIGSLFVYPKHRRRGIGEAAIRELERVAEEVGADTITMNTAAVGESMRRYERMGYRQYKKERKYPLEVVHALGLSEDYCDAAFLEKKLVV
ncbi:hypothetical protein FRB90_002612 [Tulasnella sp. 427]|nr:hypothetical protein FRB90_002612 [Tulasnella sp. 427]